MYLWLAAAAHIKKQQEADDCVWCRKSSSTHEVLGFNEAQVPPARSFLGKRPRMWKIGHTYREHVTTPATKSYIQITFFSLLYDKPDAFRNVPVPFCVTKVVLCALLVKTAMRLGKVQMCWFLFGAATSLSAAFHPGFEIFFASSLRSCYVIERSSCKVNESK